MPQSAVTWWELSFLGAGLLFCTGMAFGATWTIQTMRWKLDQLADQRRALNSEWLALRDACNELDSCPRCGYWLVEQGRHQIEPNDPVKD